MSRPKGTRTRRKLIAYPARTTHVKKGKRRQADRRAWNTGKLTGVRRTTRTGFERMD